MSLQHLMFTVDILSTYNFKPFQLVQPCNGKKKITFIFDKTGNYCLTFLLIDFGKTFLFISYNKIGLC